MEDPHTDGCAETLDSREQSGAEDELLGVPNEQPDRPVFAPDGTDLTLIREMLKRTPEERIRALEAMVESIYRLRDARKT